MVPPFLCVAKGTGFTRKERNSCGERINLLGAMGNNPGKARSGSKPQGANPEKQPDLKIPDSPGDL
jgi:hypothetical protein